MFVPVKARQSTLNAIKNVYETATGGYGYRVRYQTISDGILRRHGTCTLNFYTFYVLLFSLEIYSQKFSVSQHFSRPVAGATATDAAAISIGSHQSFYLASLINFSKLFSFIYFNFRV